MTIGNFSNRKQLMDGRLSREGSVLVCGIDREVVREEGVKIGNV